MSTKFTDELMGMMVNRQLLNSYFSKLKKKAFGGGWKKNSELLIGSLTEIS